MVIIAGKMSSFKLSPSQFFTRSREVIPGQTKSTYYFLRINAPKIGIFRAWRIVFWTKIVALRPRYGQILGLLYIKAKA